MFIILTVTYPRTHKNLLDLDWLNRLLYLNGKFLPAGSKIVVYRQCSMKFRSLFLPYFIFLLKFHVDRITAWLT